jgi:DNA-binding IclR family transcriptional regulator
MGRRAGRSHTALTAHLWIPAYSDVVCVLHAPPTIPPQEPQPMLRELLPAHACVPGKALLAHREAWREDLLSRPLTRQTPQTLTDPRDLLADLNRSQQRGYATDHEEHQPGRHAIAAPILQADTAIAALGVTPTAPEHDRADPDTLAATITTHATALTEALNPTAR